MAALRQRVQQALASRRERQMLRSLAPASEAQSDEQQQQMVDFSSNDYLSFARSPALRRRFLDAVNDPRQAHEGPYGPPSSRLLDGNSRAHRVLEDRLTSFFRGDAGLLFNSGFDANVGLWTCLPAPEDFVVYDELVHASTHDGMRASRVPRASRRSFKHNSVEHLAAVLRELKETHEGVRTGVRSVWIGVETVYSMDGTVARLGEMVDVAERILERGNVHFVVDEAHSTGLYGPQGRGLVCALGLANRITIRLHTFGKAMACSGGEQAHSPPRIPALPLTRETFPAVVLCNPLLRHYLINYARPLIYSTVMPHVNVLLISCALDMLLNGESDQVRLSLPSTLVEGPRLKRCDWSHSERRECMTWQTT